MTQPRPPWPQRTDSGSTHAATSGEATQAEIVHSADARLADAPENSFGATQHGMFGVRDGGDTSGFGGLVREPFVAPAAQRPYGSYFDEVVDFIGAASATAADAILKVVVDRGELTLHIQTEKLATVARVLRDDSSLRFELLSSVSGVDYLGTERRLHVVYELRSMTYRRRIRLEVGVTVENPHVPSMTTL
jgi:NADH-quinone oxidoreductase subunit C